jgi:hypothetical protein
VGVVKAAAQIFVLPQCNDSQNQGDQIGRIFAYRAIVFFRQSLKNYKSSENSWATFSTGQVVF